MTHREVLRALSGLLMGMFVSILAGTVVSTSLPLIIADLGGSQSSYTWVVTATMLAMAVSTPVWGKLADIFNRKLLIQLALTVFVLGSAAAGFSQNTDFLIAARAVQGLGAGGLAALSQIILADIISPRERGRYAGLFGAVMAVGSVGGPLLGGVITDAFGWRWNFFVAMPVAIAALVMLQLTLHLPTHDRPKPKIDYLGAVLITSGVSLLLIWVSLVDQQFGWASVETVSMVGGSVLLLVAAVMTELRAQNPMVPLTMFRDRTFTLAVIASLAVGVSMFGTAVFLAQYMQLARGATPTESGLLTIPMMAGLLTSSTFFGQFISRTGHWKPVMVAGSLTAVVGSAMLGMLDGDSPMWYVSVAMLVLGAGLGMLMQNLVLVVQNSIAVENLGAATSAVTFFRTIGGTAGVSVLGSVLALQVKGRIADGLATLAPEQQAQAAQALSGGSVPKIADLPPSIATIVEHAYGASIGHLFLLTVPLTLITVIAVALLPRQDLGTLTAVQAREQAEPVAAGAAGMEDPTGTEPTARTMGEDSDDESVPATMRS
ncbi:DHA2 family efflux MFS transporter permease subunit [Aeromicrobium phragmitis]|uniref:DHA2 family efflux MFS transporter permease subunit n=2 Tax=Aeromicrobium phragmitis TaxID=2478914 RepID=A0A3L8PIF0_9ACTN|nr:DHA2 family efflux MFS transporter permease subunit [Aeromicrobium phragmitis]